MNSVQTIFFDSFIADISLDLYGILGKQKNVSFTFSLRKRKKMKMFQERRKLNITETQEQ